MPARTPQKSGTLAWLACVKLLEDGIVINVISVALVRPDAGLIADGLRRQLWVDKQPVTDFESGRSGGWTLSRAASGNIRQLRGIGQLQLAPREPPSGAR